MTNVELLEEALGHVESESIRKWANSPRNRPIFEEMAQRALDKNGGKVDPLRFGTYVVCLAIGA